MVEPDAEVAASKARFLKMIDDHKNKLTDPVEMLGWVWLRVFLLNIPEADFRRYLQKTVTDMSR